jgi:hypothetical protein
MVYLLTRPTLSRQQAELFVSGILHSRIDRIEQFLFVERLVQKCHRSSFKGLGSPNLILVRCDKRWAASTSGPEPPQD